MKEVEIWTDGACKNNPGPGGWGAWLRCGPHSLELCGGSMMTTNNQMELMAPAAALNHLKEPCRVRLHTDSKYVKDGITGWVFGWRKNNWKTKSGQPVKNVELWQQLIEACERHKVEWIWVKGHDGIEGNEKADELANLGVQKALAEAPGQSGG